MGTFIVENNRFCFDIPQIILLFWILFQSNMEFYYNSNGVFNKIRKYNFLQ
jgi:hypothetical protein